LGLAKAHRIMTASLRHFLIRHKERFRFLKPFWVAYRVGLGALPWRWLPCSSRLLGPPRGYHETVRDYLDSGAADSRDRVHPGAPAETIVRVAPRSLEEPVHGKFALHLRQEVPPESVYELHGVRFWGDYAGTLIGRDDRVLGDLTRDIWEVRRHKIFTKFRLPRCRQLAGTTAILSVAAADVNYWHWTFEVLPRIDRLRRAGFSPESIDWFVVNHRDLPFQRETLADLGVPWSKVIRADAALQLECAHAVTTSLMPERFAVTAAACAFLNARAAAQWPEARPGRRLFISRRQAGFRRLLNEEAVLAELRPRGFEVVECEGLTVAEQRRCFREAAVVVAPHGAGLTNLVYCQPGTRVLEFMPPRYVDLSFWCFTSHLRMVHGVLMGEGERPADSLDPMARQDDLTISVERLRAALALLQI
jgi:capsular polysaccharide biosynthesis protein